MIYFSNFAKTKNRQLSKHVVAISTSQPTYFAGIVYPDLFPGFDLVNAIKSAEIDQDQYIRKYLTKLRQLDIDKVIADLDGKILVCYCKSDTFCHRHLVRAWLKSKIETREL